MGARQGAPLPAAARCGPLKGCEHGDTHACVPSSVFSTAFQGPRQATVLQGTYVTARRNAILSELFVLSAALLPLAGVERIAELASAYRCARRSRPQRAARPLSPAPWRAGRQRRAALVTEPRPTARAARPAGWASSPRPRRGRSSTAWRPYAATCRAAGWRASLRWCCTGATAARPRCAAPAPAARAAPPSAGNGLG